MAFKKKTVHVLYNRTTKLWFVQIGKSRIVKGMHRVQSQAIAKGRREAKRLKTELLIHGVDGKIRAKHSYGHDPRNVPG